ncbi:MAG: rod shape-determining protein MreC [Candidatus Levybacteria bacterium]|nr:rod shape-determining protein MreC [Candidatus Levybacteria bacterium]
MHKRVNLFFTFLVFIFLSFAIIMLQKAHVFDPVLGLFEKITAPFQKITLQVFNFPGQLLTNNEIKKLKDENAVLLKKLTAQKTIEEDNKALKDQFETKLPVSLRLLPVNIIGSPSFVPGLSMPEYFVIDHGLSSGIKTGQAVIFKDNVVGKIIKVSSNIAIVNLLTSESSSFTVKTLETQALGVIKGQGNGEMTLDNVLLSDKLQNSDAVITKGDFDINGTGYPQDLVIGKIVSIEKKPSSLFQTASVKSLLNFNKLSTIFVVMGYKE